jgi:hypothetical protein
MNRTIPFVSTTTLAAMVAILVPAPIASADEWNKKTTVTISESLEVPGVTLAPGSYVFKLADSASNRHIVVIQNQRENKTLATILAIPNYRLQPTDKSEFLFWETPAGQPRAVRAWFYPADNFGQEFVYPKGRPDQRAQVTPTVTPAAAAAPQPTPPPAPAAQEPVEVAQNTPPPPPDRQETPAVERPQPRAPEPTPVAPESNTPRVLPETASNLPFLTLIGFLSVAGSLGLGAIAKRIGG